MSLCSPTFGQPFIFFLFLTNFGLITCLSNLKIILNEVGQYRALVHSCVGKGLKPFSRVDPAFTMAIVLMEFPDGNIAIKQIL
jgi:hypothetical protein